MGNIKQIMVNIKQIMGNIKQIMGNIKQIPYWRPTNTRRSRTTFILLGNLAPEICEPLC